MNNQTAAARRVKRPSYFAISPHLIMPRTVGDFAVYLKQQGRMVLYASKGEQFTPMHRVRLSDLGVKRLWILADDRDSYDDYVRINLSELVSDEDIPVEARAEAWCSASETMIRDMFDLESSDDQLVARLSRIRGLLKGTLKFITEPSVLRELGRFLRNGFEEHQHGLSCMVLTASVLDTYEKIPGSLLTACCIGSILHDIGKSRLSETLRNADPAMLGPEELPIWRTHPSVGVSVCSRLPLQQETLQCILFHHEREDGRGFPSGGSGNDLPFYPRVLSLCNAYDNLTRPRAGREPLTPFEALTQIKADHGAYDPDMLRRLIRVLSKAELV
ncbi:MAG: HD domain-containing phosphohydrolase [Desulfovibrionaceae bacterium]